MRSDAKEDRPVSITSVAFVSKEFQSNGKFLRITMMNIADDSKKVHLTKVHQFDLFSFAQGVFRYLGILVGIKEVITVQLRF